MPEVGENKEWGMTANRFHSGVIKIFWCQWWWLYNSAIILKNKWTVSLQGKNFMPYELYLIKTAIKRKKHKNSTCHCLFFTIYVCVYVCMYAFLAVMSLHCYAQAFSSCRVQASHCGGFCCCGAWALKWAGVSSYCLWTR